MATHPPGYLLPLAFDLQIVEITKRLTPKANAMVARALEDMVPRPG